MYELHVHYDARPQVEEYVWLWEESGCHRMYMIICCELHALLVRK